MFQYSSLAEKPFDQWEIATHWRPHHCDPHLDQTKFIALDNWWCPWWLYEAVGGDGDWDGAGDHDGDHDGDADGDHDGDDEEVNSKGCAETRPGDAEQLRLLDTNSIKSFSKTHARGKLLIEPLLESDDLFAWQQKTANKGTWASTTMYDIHCTILGWLDWNTLN